MKVCTDCKKTEQCVMELDAKLKGMEVTFCARKEKINVEEVDLKRCPCCDGEAKIMYNHDSFTDTYEAYIECQECGLRTKEIDTTLKFGQHIPSYNPIDFLITAWNTRKSMQNIVERLEELYDDISVQYETNYESGIEKGYCDAIQIVKEEGGV